MPARKKPVPRKSVTTLTVSIDSKTKELIVAEALKRGVSVSGVVASILKDGLKI